MYRLYLCANYRPKSNGQTGAATVRGREATLCRFRTGRRGRCGNPPAFNATAAQGGNEGRTKEFGRVSGSMSE